MTDIRAALDAMREDARRWHAAAAMFDAPLSAISGLRLTERHVSIAGRISGLHTTHNGARDSAEAMLRTAAAVFDEMGRALTASADAYANQDQASAGTIDRLRR